MQHVACAVQALPDGEDVITRRLAHLCQVTGIEFRQCEPVADGLLSAPIVVDRAIGEEPLVLLTSDSKAFLRGPGVPPNKKVGQVRRA